jgi:hypothetical protein
LKKDSIVLPDATVERNVLVSKLLRLFALAAWVMIAPMRRVPNAQVARFLC